MSGAFDGTVPVVTPDRFRSAATAIDSINATDPSGEALERSLKVADWVHKLDPSASEVQLLAARAHHLGRWKYPRSEFPVGRAGYLRWRRDAAKRQAEELEEILVSAGYTASEALQACAIVMKQDLGTDPAVQIHEDALCLSFLEEDLGDFVGEHGEDKTVDVLVRTMAKMGPKGLAEAGKLELTDLGSALLERAVEAAGP